MLQKYDANQIWNANKSGPHANKNARARVLSMRSVRQVHQQIPDEREHISILSCINAKGEN